MRSEDRFAGKAAVFASHYRTGRGRVRLALVLERLARYLSPPPATVLDAGGGTGAFAVPLAQKGYDVTILDRSAEWLAEAEREAAAAGVRVLCVEGPVEEVERLTPGPFDAVLCHTVLIYCEDPVAVLGGLRRVARPGAVLSSLEKNRDALPARPAREGDFEEALRVMDDPIASGRLGVPNRALDSGELRSMMVRAGWLPERWAGLRVYSDGIPEELDQRAFDVALELDRRAATREPHRRLGRLLHVTARAWEPEPLDVIQRRSFDRAGEGTRESWPSDRALVSGRLEPFLHRKRYAALSTTRPDGRPHSTMVAYCVRDGRVWLPTVAAGQRLKNARAEPSASLLISEGEGEEHVVAMIEGAAAIHDDPAPLLESWLREEWRDRYGTELDWAGAIIELIPTKVLSYSAV